MTTSNATSMQLAQREKSLSRFRKVYNQLDEVLESLYKPSYYTMAEYDELTRTYRLLQTEADQLEESLRRNFPHKQLDVKIRWLKCNPHDSYMAEEFCRNPYTRWSETEAQKRLDEQEKADSRRK